MKVIAVVLAITALAASGVLGSTIRAQQSTPSRSIVDGVYTEDQAKRGQMLYAEECSSCHGSELGGTGDMVPPLAGPTFVGDWNGLSLGDLVNRIRMSMPADSPGKLSSKQCADVVAFLLKFGGYPAGTSELPSEPAPLDDIRFEALKP